MPLHFTPTTEGQSRIADRSLYDPGDIFLAIGDLTGSSLTPWVSSIDAPNFDPDSTELENLIGLRRPDLVQFVSLNEGSKGSFEIDDIVNSTGASKHFLMVANSTEYCIWIDSTGFDPDPTSAGRVSIKVFGLGGTYIPSRLAAELNGITGITATVVGDKITVSGEEEDLIMVTDVSTGFTFTSISEGSIPGLLVHGGKHYDISSDPTDLMYVQYHIDADNVPTSIIYQFGLYQDPVLDSSVNSGDMFILPAKVTSPGTFIGGVNSFPIQRATNKQNIVNFIIAIGSLPPPEPHELLLAGGYTIELDGSTLILS